jgi:hypothetical protein
MAYFVMTAGLRERLLASGLARIINVAPLRRGFSFEVRLAEELSA